MSSFLYGIAKAVHKVNKHTSSPDKAESSSRQVREGKGDKSPRRNGTAETKGKAAVAKAGGASVKRTTSSESASSHDKSANSQRSGSPVVAEKQSWSQKSKVLEEDNLIFRGSPRTGTLCISRVHLRTYKNLKNSNAYARACASLMSVPPQVSIRWLLDNGIIMHRDDIFKTDFSDGSMPPLHSQVM